MALPSDSGRPASGAPNYGGSSAIAVAATNTGGVAALAAQAGGAPSYGAAAVATNSAAAINYGGAKSNVSAALPSTISATTFPSYIGGFAIGLSPIGVGV